MLNKRLFFSLFLLAALPVFSQTPDFTNRIIVDMWGELDAYPESTEAQDLTLEPFDYSISRVKAVSEFLINGMIYGWNFYYTPQDKARNVQEYFESEPINNVDFSLTPITYRSPIVLENKMHAWAEYERTKEQLWTYKQWTSISTKKAQGRGYGKVSDGFDGIINATNNAIIDALRSYYRQIIKNKPKEIDGKIIITKAPRIGIVEGQYTVELDFFLETDRIIKYTQF